MTEPAKRAAKKTARPATGLAATMRAAPKLSAPELAQARVAEWLGEISRSQAGKTIRPLLAPAKGGKLPDVVAAIAEASPYLWDLIRADPKRFVRLLQADPETRFAEIIGEMGYAANA